jgi:hypothetical protein
MQKLAFVMIKKMSGFHHRMGIAKDMLASTRTL